MVRYGYARISTKSQKLDRQIQGFNDVGIDVLITDEQSRKDFSRKGYQTLKKKLYKGDELYLKSIDRLGRNYEEIIQEWSELTQKCEVDIIVLDFPLLNTKNQPNGLTGRFLSNLVLQVLSYVAQVEREHIRERQREGIAIVQQNGIRFGRPKLEHPANYHSVVARYRSGEISSIRKAASLLDVSYSTLRICMKEDQQQLLEKKNH